MDDTYVVVDGVEILQAQDKRITLDELVSSDDDLHDGLIDLSSLMFVTNNSVGASTYELIEELAENETLEATTEGQDMREQLKVLRIEFLKFMHLCNKVKGLDVLLQD